MRLLSIATAAIVTCGSVSAQPFRAIPEEPRTDIGYESPEAAEKALRVKPGVTVIEKDGWLFFADKVEQTFWNIALHSNRAYPTAVKRTVVGPKGSAYMDMRVQCGASKETCDEVVRSFQALNNEIIQRATH